MSSEMISVVIDASESVDAVVSDGVEVDALVEEFGPPGASVYDTWLAIPGNAGGTPDEFIEAQRGPPGVTPISADANNRLTTGTDGGLHVPDIMTDPLAYYILAKA